MKKLSYSLLLFMCFGNILAQGGQLDASFGVNGTYQFDIGFTQTMGRDLVIQPDGNMISLGTLDGEDDVIILTRFLPNGNLDASFGSQGKVIYSMINGRDIYGLAMTLQTDGKIIVAGYLEASSSNLDVLLLRFNANGALDTSFGNSGVVISNLGSTIEAAYAVTVQDDGKILTAGRTGYPNEKMFIQRFSDKGLIDPTFNGNGTLLIDLDPSEYDALFDLIIQPDGKILTTGVGAGAGIALIRLLPSGLGDPDFGVNGIINHKITGYLA